MRSQLASKTFVIIRFGGGLASVRRQASIWTNADS